MSGIPSDLFNSLLKLQPAAYGQRYLSAVGFVILYWDHLLTFTDEVELIWTRPFNRIKFLFIVLRYGVGTSHLVVCYAVSGLSRNTPDSFCMGFLAVVAAMALLSWMIVNYLMILGMYALWDRRQWVLKTLLIAYAISACISCGMACASVVEFVHNTRFDNQFFHMCAVDVRPKYWVGIWASQVLFNVLVLTLLFINASSRPRTEDVKLMNDLRRDGGLFYLTLTTSQAMFLLCFLNLILSVVDHGTEGLFLVAVPFSWAAITVTACRLTLRLQRMLVDEERQVYYETVELRMFQ
ncbi:hypothetical protein BV25DRAFT_1841922 [Artomyces pyxidatus]|uniref:Uncharacterized protein n=1 Tax=Artomyces pyxidatus TaxID=48021 RepID=A0ACB8SM70_9AGAM|nr:hypothetical protein BV25DRAFT_1841922 [Artomyces pyxidatus]